MCCGSFTSSSSSSSFRGFYDDSLLFFLLAFPLFFFLTPSHPVKKKPTSLSIIEYPRSLPALFSPSSRPCFPPRPHTSTYAISLSEIHFSSLFYKKSSCGFFSTSPLLPSYCALPLIGLSPFHHLLLLLHSLSWALSPVLHHFFCHTYLLTTLPSSALHLPFCSPIYYYVLYIVCSLQHQVSH